MSEPQPPDWIKKTGIGSHHSRRAKTVVWLSPPEIPRALGPFDLDPCSPPDMPWTLAPKIYTEADNGLVQPWEGRVWCNPPYGDETGKWLAKCAEHRNATALVYARTETQDWHAHIWPKATAILFFEGRLFFHYPTGARARINAGGPSALIAYDESNAAAIARSGLRGRIVRP